MKLLILSDPTGNQRHGRAVRREAPDAVLHWAIISRTRKSSRSFPRNCPCTRWRGIRITRPARLLSCC